MAEGTFLKAGGRGQIRPWPGAQELLAAAWGAGAATWTGLVGWGSLAVSDQVPPWASREQMRAGLEPFTGP